MFQIEKVLQRLAHCRLRKKDVRLNPDHCEAILHRINELETAIEILKLSHQNELKRLTT